MDKTVLDNADVSGSHEGKSGRDTPAFITFIYFVNFTCVFLRPVRFFAFVGCLCVCVYIGLVPSDYLFLWYTV